MNDKNEKFDIEAAVERMQKYWATYTDLQEWKKYDKEMFLNDALYSIGHCMYDHKYRFADGFQRFRDFLGARFFKEKLKRKTRRKVADNEK